jgi:integrase
MVFHTLNRSDTHGWHQRPSVNHSDYLKKLGVEQVKVISDSLTENKHFHSWRHTFITRLTNEFVKSNEATLHVDLIAGHAFAGAVQRGYNHLKKVTLVPTLKGSIERLPLNDFDLSCIRNHWK